MVWATRSITWVLHNQRTRHLISDSYRQLVSPQVCLLLVLDLSICTAAHTINQIRPLTIGKTWIWMFLLGIDGITMLPILINSKTEVNIQQDILRLVILLWVNHDTLKVHQLLLNQLYPWSIMRDSSTVKWIWVEMMIAAGVIRLQVADLAHLGTGHSQMWYWGRVKAKDNLIV